MTKQTNKKRNVILCCSYLNKNQYIIRFLTSKTVEVPSLLSRESKGNHKYTHGKMPAMFHQQTLRQPGSQYLLIGRRKTPKMTGICTNKKKYWDSDHLSYYGVTFEHIGSHFLPSRSVKGFFYGKKISRLRWCKCCSLLKTPRCGSI